MKNIFILLLLITVSAASLHSMEHPNELEEEKEYNFYELHRAIEDNDIATVEKLLEDNKSIKIRDCSKSDFIYQAACKGNREILHRMLNFHCKCTYTNRQDQSGNTPLHFAVHFNRTAIISLLLKHKPILRIRTEDLSGDITMNIVTSIDLQNSQGNTPLHFAAYKGDLDIVRLLLENGACDKVNEHGLSPLDAAINQGHHEVANCIQTYRSPCVTDIWDLL